MGCYVELAVLLALSVFDDSAAASNTDVTTTTEWPQDTERGLRLLHRILGYLSLSDLHKFYWAVIVLDEPTTLLMKNSILEKVEFYGLQNHITLDLNEFDVDPAQGPISINSFECMELFLPGDSQPRNSIPPWRDVMIPNSVCEVCYRYRRPTDPVNDPNDFLLISRFALPAGYYEPRMRVRLNPEFTMDSNDMLGVTCLSQGQLQQESQLSTDTLYDLRDLQTNKGHEWFSLRLPVHRVVTADIADMAFVVLDNLKRPLLTIDGFEMRQTNAAAFETRIDPSALDTDVRGDVLVSIEYHRP